METHDANDVLQSLLDKEKEASSLVTDAQAEADRRLAAAEKKGREEYDAAFKAEADKLEADYNSQLAAETSRYNQNSEQYRAKLDALPVNQAAFSQMVDKLL
jgi:vacuolar-type H+-ATPase subunit H